MKILDQFDPLKGTLLYGTLIVLLVSTVLSGLIYTVCLRAHDWPICLAIICFSWICICSVCLGIVQKGFRKPWNWRPVRKPDEVGSVTEIWQNKYPNPIVYKRRTVVEKLVMTFLVLRAYSSVSYPVRGFFIKEEWESQFMELYVILRGISLFFLLVTHMWWSCWLLPFAVMWVTAGSLLHPLRIFFVDRYGKEWSLLSPPRSLIFVFVEYFQIIIGFAYMYLHLGLIAHSDCSNPITNVWDALYFSVVTITTLGYGDLRPISRCGRVLAAVEPIMGIVLLVVVVGFLFLELGRQKTSKNHK